MNNFMECREIIGLSRRNLAIVMGCSPKKIRIMENIFLDNNTILYLLKLSLLTNLSCNYLLGIGNESKLTCSERKFLIKIFNVNESLLDDFQAYYLPKKYEPEFKKNISFGKKELVNIFA
jgi:hypothetical protein